MKNSLTIALGTIVGVLALCALTTLCLVGAVILSGPHGTPTPIGIVSPLEPPLQGTSVPTHGTPTSTASVLVLGQSVLYNNVRVSINQYEFSGAYGTRSFLEEKPKSGFKFLWVYVSARNEGNSPGWLPRAGVGSQFFVIYGDQQFSEDFPISERSGYPRYEAGNVLPGIKREGWIRFSVPEPAQPVNLKIGFDAAAPLAHEYYFWQLGK